MSALDVEFEIPSWEEIYELLLELADQIREDGFETDVVVGVSRGGWPPARVMSDLLEKPQLVNVATEFYLGVAETKGEPVITQPVSASVKGKKVLVVDDIADTGKSLKLIQTHLKERGATEIRVAAIYHKPWSIVVPDYYQKDTTSWVIFPWERKETIRKILEKYECEGKPVKEAAKKLVRSGLDRNLVKRFMREISGEDS
jgi:hypothetical protein